MTQDSKHTPIDLATIRQRLAETRGRHFWRSLDEIAETPEFQEFLHREFPRGASEMRDPLTRRTFLKLMGASLALAGLSGCASRPAEKIIPYVNQPEEIVPGKPLFFATATTFGGFARGLLAESHTGRPTKVEGNPDHPASLGASDIFAQASILMLYDPDRSQAVLNKGEISTWESFLTTITNELEVQRAAQGAGLRILTETVTSPTLADQIQTLLKTFPAAKWYQYDPTGPDNIRAGMRLAFGEDVDPIYHFDLADRILALDSDFLFAEPGSIRYARAFIDRRRVRSGQTTMNRLYVAESTPTITGSMADHRFPVHANQIEGFARAVTQRLGVNVGSAPTTATATIPAAWLDALATDLKQHSGTSLVLAGNYQPPIVHALAHAINQALGNIGKTVTFIPPVEANPGDQTAGLRALVGEMAAGKVQMLIMIGGNPVYTAPADIPFADQLAKVGTSVHLGMYDDETSARSTWHVPQTHYLEAWSDARAYDGTASIMQPLIAPLYNGKSAHEVLAVLMGSANSSSYDLVRGYWKNHGLADDKAWRKAVHDGVVGGTALTPRQVSLNAGFAAQSANPQPSSNGAQGLELIFRPDPTIWDGHFANNGWLQELPKPLNKLTWDNAALISPATAERLGLANEELVELRYKGRVVRAPIWIVPGHVDDAVTVTLGYGRTRAGRVGTGTGFNAYAIRTSDAPWFGSGLELVKTGDHYQLATTHDHQSMEGRDLVRVATFDEYQKNPYFARDEERSHLPSLYPQVAYNGYAWGMSIDLNACIGCNACVLACQAENNIPIVGKDQVLVSREMHWIRIDRYYSGGLDNPQTYHEPVPCMQCENAPCELVCPVGATVHSAEGLNDMVYNRCIGTRYCSNNCPYKVRRFNFFQYARKDIPVIQLQANPDVTVRNRGVMEKCTYCVQRIDAARIQSEEESRTIRDGEILTACQQACPTQAIVFGNINDQNSQVAKLKADPRDYTLLLDLNTRPRTTYLAKLTNPNPAIKTE